MSTENINQSQLSLFEENADLKKALSFLKNLLEEKKGKL